MARKRNPQDVTLRLHNALAKRVERLEKAVKLYANLLLKLRAAGCPGTGGRVRKPKSVG